MNDDRSSTGSTRQQPDGSGEEWVAGWNNRMRAVIGSTIPMTIEHVSADRVVISMVVDSRIHQPYGLLHGGASMVLAESAASIGGMVAAPEGMAAVGQEINANHIRGVREGVVRAVAVPLHIGRTSHVWSVEIRDEAGKLVCVSRCTLAIVPAPAVTAPTPSGDSSRR
jgi:uncharacterized protein (TIGR00369 family)